MRTDASNDRDSAPGDWYVYIVECRDSTFYTGMTNNIPGRLKVHNSGKGAKYTRDRLPVTLVYFEMHESRSQAFRRERELKKWKRAKKAELVCGFQSSRIADILGSIG